MPDESQPPKEPHPLLSFVEHGMLLTYEFESLGQIEAALGQVIQFCPVLTVRGWSTHKEYVASLRLKYFAEPNRLTSQCLLDQDEICAWRRLLLATRQSGCCPEVRTNGLEYVTRHGIKLVWQARSIWKDAAYFLYVNCRQAAILPTHFDSQLLQIFDDFESFCGSYK